MDEARRAGLESEYEALVLASFDMHHAHFGALYLIQAGEEMGEVAQVLLTGVVVTYARPFTTSRGYRKLGSNWAPVDAQQKALHDDLLRLRKTFFAHSDATDMRRPVDRTTLRWQGGVGMIAANIFQFPPESWPPIRDLALDQHNRMLNRAIEIHKELDPTAGTGLDMSETPI